MLATKAAGRTISHSITGNAFDLGFSAREKCSARDASSMLDEIQKAKDWSTRAHEMR